jgi:hypothetical protein
MYYIFSNLRTIYNKNIELIMRRRIRLTESDLHKVISESVRQYLTELDWKTYMNAARKREEQGNHAAANELERYAQTTFRQQHGKNGSDHNYEGEIPTSYGGRNHRWKDGETWADDLDFEVKSPTNPGWWGGERADGIRRYRYGNGLPHLNYGELHDDTFDYAYNNKEGWDGARSRRHTMRYDKEGEKYWPYASTVGNEVSKSKDDDYNDRQERMGKDMNDYYTGKSQYVKGKGWK